MAILDLPYRRTTRLQGHDYAAPATYFVTFCTAFRDPILSDIMAGQLRLLPAGRIVAGVWRNVLAHTPEARLLAGVLMPDHVHVLVAVGAAAVSRPRPLPNLIRLVKSYSGLRINRARETPGALVWQRGFYERILRAPTDVAAYRRYIATNPQRWSAARGE